MSNANEEIPKCKDKPHIEILESEEETPEVDLLPSITYIYYLLTLRI